jgi:putative membrane protein insertion efficiency factor
MVMNRNYPEELSLRNFKITLVNFPQWLLLVLIRLYQKSISPTLPANICKFYPSCSHYSYQAIYKYGFLKGLVMTLWRVLRCNPFSKGGFDPVP